MKHAPYFLWNFLSFIISSIFLAVIFSEHAFTWGTSDPPDLTLDSLTASTTPAGNSDMSAATTS